MAAGCGGKARGCPGAGSSGAGKSVPPADPEEYPDRVTGAGSTYCICNFPIYIFSTYFYIYIYTHANLYQSLVPLRSSLAFAR